MTTREEREKALANLRECPEVLCNGADPCNAILYHEAADLLRDCVPVPKDELDRLERDTERVRREAFNMLSNLISSVVPVPPPNAGGDWANGVVGMRNALAARMKEKDCE